jgi:hypothetical protein
LAFPGVGEQLGRANGGLSFAIGGDEVENTNSS